MLDELSYLKKIRDELSQTIKEKRYETPLEDDVCEPGNCKYCRNICIDHLEYEKEIIDKKIEFIEKTDRTWMERRFENQV